MMFYLSRVRLNNGGYDRDGSYWGRGCPLYRYYSYEAVNQFGREAEGHVRGFTRADAKAKVRKKYPKAKFWR